MDNEVHDYIDAIPPAHRPLFDRVQRLILEAAPGAEIGYAYAMPTYSLGKRRIHVAVWKHGVSIYGWDKSTGFAERHPELLHSASTIRLRTDDAATVSDDDLRDLAKDSLHA